MAGLSSPSGKKFKFVSLRRKKGDTEAKFYITDKVDGKWTDIESHTQLEGKLCHAEVGTFEYDGKTKKKIIFYFDVGEESSVLKVEASFNILSRSILNTFTGALEDIKAGKNIVIQLYVNKKGYASASVRKPGTSGKDGLYSWGYPLDKFPKPKKVVVNGETVMDMTEINAKFESLITNILQPALPGIPERVVDEESFDKPIDQNNQGEAKQYNATLPKQIGTDLPPIDGPDLDDDDDLPF